MKTSALLIPALFALALPASAQVDLLTTWDSDGLGEQFGIAVSIAGDCNADGWADLAVGASANDENGTNAGKVSVFFGRPVTLSDPDVELLGPAGSFFGAAVAWVGDTNGDSYDDLLVGAFRDAQAGVNAGKAFLFLGGDPMDATPDLVLVGPEAGAYFGRAVGAAGDLNGDLLADFAVGAPRTSNGSAYVYYGADPPDATPELIINGAAPDDRFGSALAGPGNVDGLPGDDLLVGAARASVGHTWAGAAYLFSGGAALDTLPGWTVYGEDGGDQLGTSVAAAGDVNGDGDPDILVGAPYWNGPGATDAGAAYVYYGGALLDTLPDYVIEGEETEENLGRSVAGCGDVTGSGYGHVVAGGPGATQSHSVVGRFVLSPGGDPPGPGDHIVEYGEAEDDQFGYAVAGVAGGSGLSHMGDTKPDFAVGAWSHGDSGRTYVYGIESEVGIPEAAATAVALHSPSPNPTATGARITFDLPEGAARAQISIFDVAGRLVAVLHDGPAEPGRSAAVWNGLDTRAQRVACGVYFVQLTTEVHAHSQKLLVLR
jgi:hypothetical protein